MRRLAFAIHDLNSWGGQDRSTLEVARRVSHRLPVEVHSFTLEDPNGMSSWGDVKFCPVRPDVARPSIARQSLFHMATFKRFGKLTSGTSRPLVHATGTCSFFSDVVQVQFVGAAWKKIWNELPPELCAAPHARVEKKSVKTQLVDRYHRSLLDYNVAIEHQVYTASKHYIAIADIVADELRDCFGLRKNIHVIRHGVDGETFRPVKPEEGARIALRAKLGISRDDIAIAFVGAYERKGLAVAIEALSYLSRETGNRAKLLAVGGGAVEGFRRHAQELGVGEQVIFVQHQKDILPYYQASDLFLLPTYYEPFGLVTLEAMACGLAPVVSRNTGASELIVGGTSGRLIEDPRDARAIARMLDELIGDPKLRERMGNEARAVAEKRSWDQVASEYCELLGPMLR